jgi:hypothetical protein
LQWSALAKALDPTLSLAFLYLIRCSLHAAALKRNVSNMQRISRVHDDISPLASANPGRPRSFSETIDVEYNAALSSSPADAVTIEKAKPTNVSLVSVPGVTVPSICYIANDCLSCDVRRIYFCNTV